MHKSGIFHSGKSLILEAIADAQGESGPAEPAAVEIDGGAPVEGEVDRGGIKLDFRSDLPDDGGVEVENIVCRCGANLDTRARMKLRTPAEPRLKS